MLTVNQNCDGILSGVSNELSPLSPMGRWSLFYEGNLGDCSCYKSLSNFYGVKQMFNTTYNNAAIVTENILHMSVNI